MEGWGPRETTTILLLNFFSRQVSRSLETREEGTRGVAILHAGASEKMTQRLTLNGEWRGVKMFANGLKTGRAL